MPKFKNNIGIISANVNIGLTCSMSGVSPTAISEKDSLQQQIRDLQKGLQNLEILISKLQSETDKKIKEVKRELLEKEEKLKSLYDNLYKLLERLTTDDVYLLISGVFWIICGTVISTISSII